jgi:peptidoglycan hydrolase-like protein with peptidoglycan-binding domain
MTLLVSRLPFSLDPLMEEAKRRARRRWFLILGALLVVAAVSAFALRPSGGPKTSLPRPATAPSHVGLSLGSHGPVVAAWQRVLGLWLVTSEDRWARAAQAQVGYGLKVTGVFDRTTAVATQYWQRDAYQRPTGIVTRRTWKLWIGGKVTCCGAGLPSFTARDLRRFGVFPHPEVGWWQNALNHWRARRALSPIIVDGVYNRQTRAATRLFQQSVGLSPTGVATSATWLKAQGISNMLALP